MNTTLYRLHTGILARRSKLFATIFSLWRDLSTSSGALDGQDDDHPFVLPSTNITPGKFEHLLTYLLCGPRCELPWITLPFPWSNFLRKLLVNIQGTLNSLLQSLISRHSWRSRMGSRTSSKSSKADLISTRHFNLNLPAVIALIIGSSLHSDSLSTCQFWHSPLTTSYALG